jgi:hypothetical protein
MKRGHHQQVPTSSQNYTFTIQFTHITALLRVYAPVKLVRGARGQGCQRSLFSKFLQRIDKKPYQGIARLYSAPGLPRTARFAKDDLGQ